MKIISAHNHSIFGDMHYHSQQSILETITAWIEEQEPLWDYNRFGIAATGIFIQVTFAAVMTGVLGMAGASPWAYGIGIFIAFMANSIAFAQSKMRLVLGLFIVSIIVNLSMTLFYGLPLLLN